MKRILNKLVCPPLLPWTSIPHHSHLPLVSPHLLVASPFPLCPLPAKSAEKVLSSLQQYCHSYGYPKSILCDNGREFCNQIMETFCQNNGITMKHRAPRMPTTQGLIERSNRSCKEVLHTLIVSTTRNNSKWCSYLSNISYTRNITFHTAINN